MAQPFGNATNITTNTTLTMTGAKQLTAIIINTKGASSNTATIFDNTSATGTKIGTLDTTVAIGTVLYLAILTTGLTIVTANGTPADLTVIWA